jgi:hypothetical protein
MARRRNDLQARRVTPETARRIVNAQKKAKAERVGIRLARPEDQAMACGIKAKRTRKPKATDYVPQALSESQTATGHVTSYMRLGTKIRNRRTVVINGHVIGRNNDVPVRAQQKVRTARTRGTRRIVATIQSDRY